jgi:hypothetical protein
MLTAFFDVERTSAEAPTLTDVIRRAPQQAADGRTGSAEIGLQEPVAGNPHGQQRRTEDYSCVVVKGLAMSVAGSVRRLPRLIRDVPDQGMVHHSPRIASIGLILAACLAGIAIASAETIASASTPAASARGSWAVTPKSSV